jgi:hypothetical protein
MSASKITALETRVAELEKKVEALMTQKPTVATATTGGKVKKEKVKRAPSAWSLFVKHVTSEMKAANPDGKLKLPDIAAEAKKRKDSGGYDEAHWKEMVSKLTA